MPETKDHYVPESYLQNFCAANSKINIYDKDKKKAIPYPTHCKKVAKQGSFYALPKGIKYTGKSLEDKLSEFEKLQIKLINHVLKKVDKIWDFEKKPLIQYTKAITSDQKKELAYIIAIQYLRTPAHRKFLSELYQLSNSHLEEEANIMFEQIVNQITSELPNQHQNKFSQMALDIKNQVIQLNINMHKWLSREGISIIQAQDMFKFCPGISEILLNHYWLIGLSTFESEKTFYTSDHPVSQHGYDQAAGLSSKGVEIVFPLSSKVILILREKEYFNKYKNFDNKILPLTTDQIDYYNSFQVTSSDRFIYCREQDFKLVEQIIQTNPYDLSSKRQRFKVTY